jgi:hypothetical protein
MISLTNLNHYFDGYTGIYTDVYYNPEQTIKVLTFYDLIGKDGIVTNTSNNISIDIETIKNEVGEFAFSVYVEGKMFILYRPEGYIYANNKLNK